MFFAAWLLFCFFLSSVESLGTLELRLLKFRNPSGRDVSGACCHWPPETPPDSEPLELDPEKGTPKPVPTTRNPKCRTPCATYFRICLKQYQTDIDPDPPCTYLSRIISMRKSDEINFSKDEEIKLPFSFNWPGSVSIIIEAFHNGSATPKESKQLLLRVAAPRYLAVSHKWTSEVHKTAPPSVGEEPTTLSYKYRAVCDPHYFGKDCSNYCVPKDNPFGHYQCTRDGAKICMPGWQGRDCNEAICSPGCHPEFGKCSVPGTCDCEVGYIGENCTECQKWPGCKRGACSKPFECICEEGWGGLFCNQDLNYCTHYHPCQNGATCVNTGAGHYTCQCLSGYTGTNCQTKLEDCSQSPCENGGTCRELPASSNYTCDCPQGFSGRHCQSSAQSCKDQPCEHGSTCVDIAGTLPEGGYMCLCAPGWEGQNCDLERDECKPNPCANGGQCIDDFNAYRCVCPVGFSGDRCQKNDNDCSANTCLNGGTCVDQINSFKCECPPGFMGTLCQDNIDDCLKRPCAYGGTCFDLVNDYKCVCRPGFKGKDCSIDINECESSPCRNGGSCVDSVDDYKCHCPKCFSGPHCQILDEECIASESAKNGHLYIYHALNSTGSQHVVSRSVEDRSRDPNMTFVYLLATVLVLMLLFVLVFLYFCYRRMRRSRDENASKPVGSTGNHVMTIDSLSSPDMEALRQNAANKAKLLLNSTTATCGNAHVTTVSLKNNNQLCGSTHQDHIPPPSRRKLDNTQIAAELLQRSGKFPTPPAPASHSPNPLPSPRLQKPSQPPPSPPPPTDPCQNSFTPNSDSNDSLPSPDVKVVSC